VLCATLALFLRWLLNPILGGTAVPYITLFPAVMLSAWACGIGPGLATTFLGATGARYFFIDPVHSFSVCRLGDLLGLGLFVGIGSIVAYLNEALRKMRIQTLEHVRHLRNEVRERERADEALRESRERLQLALEAANEGLWDLNVRTGIAYYSPQYYRMLGFDVDEWPATYQNWLGLLHPEDRPTVDAQRTSQIKRQNGTFDLQYRLRKKGGAYAWVRSRGRVVSFAADGTPERLIGTLMDITDANKLEEQLRQAQRLDSIGRLAGGIAHDFNNLLTVINGYAAMSVDDLSIDSPVRNSLQEIYAAGQRAAELTQQLLAFSRKQLLRPVIVDLNKVIRDLSKMLNRLIGEDISLVMRLAPDLRNITADPSQVQQVIMNLAVNSRDAMPNGGTLIIETGNIYLDEEYVSGHPQVQPGNYSMLAVTDDGIGMSAETQERLFEPFFTTKAKGQGTGLGLSTVYGIVRQSGGRVWVYSEPNRGTTFKVYFPSTEQPASDSAPAVKGDQHGHETILVVEDQDEVRNLAVRALEKFGYTVFSAKSAEDAVAFCSRKEHALDLVVTDVIMPGMNGGELARQLRSLNPKLRVLFMSGYTDNVIAHRGVLDEGVEFLQKPFTADRLAEQVRTVLGSSGPAGVAE
jgi:two-component system cell cycle sensor histidine kinase/response regulator CckA